VATAASSRVHRVAISAWRGDGSLAQRRCVRDADDAGERRAPRGIARVSSRSFGARQRQRASGGARLRASQLHRLPRLPAETARPLHRRAVRRPRPLSPCTITLAPSSSSATISRWRPDTSLWSQSTMSV
jgi:hypothetical protein